MNSSNNTPGIGGKLNVRRVFSAYFSKGKQVIKALLHLLSLRQLYVNPTGPHKKTIYSLETRMIPEKWSIKET